MNASSLNIDYEVLNQENMMNDIENICKDSYNKLFANIRLTFLRIKLKKNVNKIVKLQDEIVRDIYKYDFDSIREFKDKISKINKTINLDIDGCKDCDYKFKYKNTILTFYLPLSESIDKTIKAIDDSFHFHAGDLYKSKEELKKHNDSLSVFADFWDDEVPEEDKKFVFDFNKESTHAI